MKNTYNAPEFKVISLVSETALCADEDYVAGDGNPTMSFPFIEDEKQN